MSEERSSTSEARLCEVHADEQRIKAEQEQLRQRREQLRLEKARVLGHKEQAEFNDKIS